MKPVLHDNSPASLITAMEANLSAWLPVLALQGKHWVNDPTGLDRVTTDIPFALFNSIMNFRLQPALVDDTLRSLQTDARHRKVPLLCWVVPSSRPQNLPAHLINNGFKLDDDGPGMLVDLSTLNEQLPYPPELNVRIARDETGWRAWSQAMALAWEFPPTAQKGIEAWYNLLRLADPETMLAYYALLGDQPAAVSLLFLSEGVAGIYAVATVPSARRKGIGARITLLPLLEARARGYHFGVLQASEMGQPVYRSLGFREYCRIQSYRWQAPEPA